MKVGGRPATQDSRVDTRGPLLEAQAVGLLTRSPICLNTFYIFCVVFMFACRKPFPKTVRKQPAFVLGELIGERVRVEESSCRELRGIEGLIVDETLGTFVVETACGRKRIPKRGSEFFFPSHEVLVDGGLLYCRPEDRTKKLFPKIFGKRRK